MRLLLPLTLACWLNGLLMLTPAWSATNVYLTEVPDYDWWRGCFGTAAGNLMGYWDRHGLPNFYTGPTADGLAPLDSNGPNAGIHSMWASKAGLDGRPAGQFGHEDDYWVEYESTAPDPYVTAGRREHSPDCIGDFIGLSQDKWTDLNNECDGNLDGFSFVYWDRSGAKRVNYVPGPQAGLPAVDIQSGLKAWTEYRGYECEVFTQLTDFNPMVPAGKGFTFDHLRAEIDAGYPVLLLLQQFDDLSRALGPRNKANPHIHGMLAYGYYLAESGIQYVRYRTSWASGNNLLSAWTADEWQAALPVRGVIGYHPWPKITTIARTNASVTVRWDGPAARLTNLIEHTTVDLHRYVLETATHLAQGFLAVSAPTTDRQATITNCCASSIFFRVKLLKTDFANSPR